MIKSWLKALSPFIWTENPSEGGRERENERERERERAKKNKKGKKRNSDTQGEREFLMY